MAFPPMRDDPRVPPEPITPPDPFYPDEGPAEDPDLPRDEEDYDPVLDDPDLPQTGDQDELTPDDRSPNIGTDNTNRI